MTIGVTSRLQFLRLTAKGPMVRADNAEIKLQCFLSLRPSVHLSPFTTFTLNFTIERYILYCLGIWRVPVSRSVADKMHFLFMITALLGVALSCPPPFNNVNFVGNETHSTSDLIEAALTQQGLGWSEAVATYGNRVKPWPKDHNEKTHTVNYCYADKDAYDSFGVMVVQAIQKWQVRLGPPGPQTGHALRFGVPRDPYGPQPWCYFIAPHERVGQWNTNYKYGTLVIRRAPPGRTRTAQALLGWLNDPAGSRPDRHYLWINPDGFPAHEGSGLVTHELGKS